VQGGCQFHDTKTGAEMSAGHRNSIDGLLAKFVSDLSDLFHLEPAQIVRGVDGVEERRFTKFGHSDIPILQAGINGPT
jgi:hypothetical protein